MRQPVTFDFDDTLLQTRWDPVTEEAVECGPNLVMLQTMRAFLDMGHEVHIVTSRVERFESSPDRTSVRDFLVEHRLHVDGVHFTNGDSKVDTLVKLGAFRHFDDDEEELDLLPNTIEGIWVPPHPSWGEAPKADRVA